MVNILIFKRNNKNDNRSSNYTEKKKGEKEK